jgi:ABC-type polysaccharide/polyol phosphate transport system ATPase subunit
MECQCTLQAAFAFGAAGQKEVSEKAKRMAIDMPVKHYSSGMDVRLGFSIAAHLEPDILLLDEVLAVGDAAFRAKCLDRINELQRHGRTIVCISHDLISVERLCRRVLLLNHGQVIAGGSPQDVIGTYEEIGTTRTRLEHGPAESATQTGEATITP